jgi:diaminopimelate epimerase
VTRFAKAHACGNDFLIVEGECDRELAVRLCARHTGVGADGVEFLEWTGDASGRIRLANADGSIAEISGNGTRCVAAWMAWQKAMATGSVVEIETDAGPRRCTLMKADGKRFEFAANMGAPAICNRHVTLNDGTAVEGVAVSTGNPHFVIFVEDESFRAHDRSWEELGRQVCFHRDFPGQTNVEFVLVEGPDRIAIRIYERGVGPTASSGTGTCASAAATMWKRGELGTLRVTAPGGEQRVDWAGAESELILTGPAELIAMGEAF